MAVSYRVTRTMLNDRALDLAEAIAATPLHALAQHLLTNVPGFPPLAQTLHLLGISAVMGSVVLIDLRILGLALPSQSARELVRRLMPWTWAALPALALSGLVFIFAQPHRYFDNPVFQLKFTMLVPAIALGAILQKIEPKDGFLARAFAAASLCLWISVVMAGRWIAYVDYLWPME